MCLYHRGDCGLKYEVRGLDYDTERKIPGFISGRFRSLR